LALDAMIQQIAARHLRQVVRKHRAKGGMLVVMKPGTGEILAMANVPSYNPNEFAKAPTAHRRNRCVTDVFEPGSIFKPIVWSALTELNVAEPKERFDCSEKGYWVTDFGRTLNDAHGMGTITWNKVLVNSSNIGMAKAALRSDNPTLHHIVRSFGFGQTTGSGLPGEVQGLVNPLEQWNEYSLTSIPMGQEIGVTALQMVRAFSVLANGGLLLEPSIEPVDDRRQREIVRRVLPKRTAQRTLSVLRRVVTDGTGRKAQSERYRFFGKTGTAQLPNFEQGGYYDDRYMSSFVGGGPTDQPRLVAGCFVRRPDPAVEHYGGLVAAPVVKTVLEESLQYLGVPPKAPEAEAEEQVATR
jgi:cell division protein FtsI (penicillin-binding protein 3)